MSEIRNKVEKFLVDFKDFQLYEHGEMVKFFLNMLDENEEFGVTEDDDKDDGHFKCCPWYYPDCEEGPDTCRCSIYYLRKVVVNHLITSYYEIVHYK